MRASFGHMLIWPAGLVDMNVIQKNFRPKSGNVGMIIIERKEELFMYAFYLFPTFHSLWGLNIYVVLGF